MKSFLSIDSHSNPQALVERGLQMKEVPGAWRKLGFGRSLGLIFLNPSLRTRLSTQKAGMNLGMDVMVMNVGGGDGWNLEMEPGVVMDGDRPEHIVDAARVISTYCDVVGLRAFAALKDRGEDAEDRLIRTFAAESSSPVVNMESAAGHPLQALADMMTIRERFRHRRPRVLLTWAPHPRPLPQAVPNSFVRWSKRLDLDLVIANPEGYDLDPALVGDTPVKRDLTAAYEGADVVYAKNWSATEPYGEVLQNDPAWMVDEAKMSRTNNGLFMHCLPVRRNVVVSDGVIDSPNAIVVPQAANREHAAQVVLAEILENLDG